MVCDPPSNVALPFSHFGGKFIVVVILSRSKHNATIKWYEKHPAPQIIFRVNFSPICLSHPFCKAYTFLSPTPSRSLFSHFAMELFRVLSEFSPRNVKYLKSEKFSVCRHKSHKLWMRVRENSKRGARKESFLSFEATFYMAWHFRWNEFSEWNEMNVRIWKRTSHKHPDWISSMSLIMCVAHTHIFRHRLAYPCHCFSFSSSFPFRPESGRARFCCSHCCLLLLLPATVIL